MRCPKCNTKFDLDNSFCPKCGLKITKADALEKSESAEIFTAILDHFEFLGYEVSSKNIENNGYMATVIHERKSNIVVRFNPNIGISLTASYLYDKDKISKRKKSFLELINNMNTFSQITCFLLGGNGESIICYGWFPPIYSKSMFGKFVDQFEADIQSCATKFNIGRYAKA